MHIFQLLGFVLGGAAIVLFAAVASVQHQQASILMSPVQSIDMRIYQDEQRLRNDLALRNQLRMQVGILASPFYIMQASRLALCKSSMRF
jgi:hypothetical protein